MSEVSSEVLIELDVPALLGGGFDLQAEVVSILEQDADAYEGLADVLQENEAKDVLAFLDKKQNIPSEYIDVNIDEAVFHGFNDFSGAVEISLPYSLDLEAIREDMRKQEKSDVNEVVDGKEITNVIINEADFVVEYNQDGLRSGMAVIPMDCFGGYEGDKTENKAIVQDMVKDGTLELPDLFERPHYSDISPALLYFYDEVCKREADDQYYFLEFELEALPEKDKRFQGKTPQDILDEIEADMILYPSLANYIEIYTDGDKDIEFSDTFRESIAESCPKNRDRKHLPVHNDIPGEVIFQEVECALKKVENEVGEDLDFKEAITHCSGISPHDVLLSLKHEAESTRVRRGNTVLFGTMKYETQKDRKDAYKWAKSWMNKSAKRLNYEIYKKQEKDKGQCK